VEAGSELLSIGSPTTQNNLVEARKQLNTLIEQDKIETAQEEESLTKLKASLNLQRSAAEASIERTRTLLTLYDKLVKDLEELSKQKLIPNSKLISARSTLFSTEENEKTLLANLANFKSQLQIQLAQTAAARSQRISRIQTAKSTLTIAESNRTLNSIVTAPFRCRIVSMMVDIGDFITPGTDIFLVVPLPPASDTSTDPLQAIGFVQYGMGKEVKPGMRVEVAIPFAKSTEYGYIKGRVSTVATFASDEAMVVQRVGSDSLGKEIVNSTSGVPLELIIDLEADPSTKSGFAWTSADGFPGVIPQLSECTIKVTTHSERPIDLVIPWFKQIIGIDAAPEISGSS
jgi:HlyD family secretion protein